MAAADTTLPAIERAKQISVYQNGDEKFPGKRIIINKRKIANFDVFLDHVTDTLRPRFGAVRRLYTPVGGHRITDLDQVIKRGEAYVAAGQEKFQRIGYLEIEVSPRKRLPRGTLEIKPVRHSRIQTSGRIRKIRTDSIIIYVHPNGNDLENPHRIQLRPREQGSWEMVLDAIKDRVTLTRGGAIRKLYTLDGQMIHSVHEIESAGCYVACGTEKFVPKDYAHPKVVMTSPRQERRMFPHGQKLTPLSNRNSKKGSQDSSANRTPDSNNGLMNNKPRKARRNQVKKEDPVIHEKPVAYKRNGKKEVNYDQDPGGVFKAHRENQATRGAQEINEDRNTRVDLPVDQREAEIVEEEEIHTSPRGRKERRASKSQKVEGDLQGEHLQRRVSFVGDTQSRKNFVGPDTYEEFEQKMSQQQSEAVGEDHPMEEAPEGFEREAEGPSSKREERIEHSRRASKRTTKDQRNDSKDKATPTRTPSPRIQSPGSIHDSPKQESPEPRRDSPEPRTESPEPRRETPEPRTVSPEPNRESPEPRRESPEPNRESSEPNRESPEPRRESPEPRRESPEPRRESPEPRESPLPAEQAVNDIGEDADVVDDSEAVNQMEDRGSAPPPDRDDDVVDDIPENRKSTPVDETKGVTGEGVKEERQPRRDAQSTSPSQVDRDRAALTIQSHYRGYRSRKGLRGQRTAYENMSTDSDPDDAEAERAAVKIQSNYRGYRTRRQLKANNHS